MKKLWIRTTLVAITAGGLALGAVAPAQAASNDSSKETVKVDVVSPGSSKTARSADGSLSTTISLGTPEAVSATTISNDPNLSKAAKTELLAAAATATVKSNRWSQFTTGGSYTQTQNGVFYYNGSRVWVTQSYSGSTGSHHCFTNYVALPWVISNTSKSDTGSTTARNLYCGWNVKQPLLGLTTYASMTATVKPNGTISGFGSTIG